MSILDGIVEPKEANGIVKQVYDKVEQKYGFVLNAIKMQSMAPETLAPYVGIVASYDDTNLGHKFRMITNRLIAELDKSEYCISLMNNVLEQKFGITKQEIDEIVKDYSKAPISEAEKALLGFIFKVLEDSNSTTKQDMQELCELGFSHKDIYDAIDFATLMQKFHMMLNAFKIDKD